MAFAGAAFASTLPPASSLYRHALEHVFGFCSLRRLHALLSVSREWSAAVQTMAPIRASCSTPPIPVSFDDRELHQRQAAVAVELLANTRLGRHVSQLPWIDETDHELLAALAQRMSWIETLQIRVDDPDVDRVCKDLAQLTRMRVLDLRCSRCTVTPLLTVVGSSLPLLESLTLRCDRFDASVCLDPLVSLPSLRLLDLVTLTRTWAPAQMDALRGLPSLEYLGCRGDPSFLAALLRPQHHFKRLMLPDRLVVTDELAPLLVSLPQLHTLRLVLRCASFDFLAHLPALSKLVLELNNEADHIVIDGLVAALQRCGRLTQLALRRLPLTAADLSALVPSLPLLCSVKLAFLPRLASLRFLATAAAASSLTRVVVSHCPACAPSELLHLHGLRRLRQLDVERLSEVVPADVASLFDLPSEVMPHLISVRMR